MSKQNSNINSVIVILEHPSKQHLKAPKILTHPLLIDNSPHPQLSLSLLLSAFKQLKCRLHSHNVCHFKAPCPLAIRHSNTFVPSIHLSIISFSPHVFYPCNDSALPQILQHERLVTISCKTGFTKYDFTSCSITKAKRKFDQRGPVLNCDTHSTVQVSPGKLKIPSQTQLR